MWYFSKNYWKITVFLNIFLLFVETAKPTKKMLFIKIIKLKILCISIFKLLILTKFDE